MVRFREVATVTSFVGDWVGPRAGLDAVEQRIMSYPYRESNLRLLGRPACNPGLVKWDLWWTKWRWRRFPPSTSVSPANLDSTKFSIIVITRGKYSRPINGRRAEWTQLDSTPY
jgi:hypothetical protein